MGIYPPVLPPDLEELSLRYLETKMAVAMGTALPKPARNATKPGPFLRVEFGGGTQPNPLEYDIDTILYSYAPDEALASLNCRTAFAHMVAAWGETIDGWYVGWSRASSLPHKSTDPKVSLPRYRAMVCWRVTGKPITT